MLGLSRTLGRMVPGSIRQRLRPRLLPLLRPRRFRAYCIGTPKSGTTSVHFVFHGACHSEHEPEFEQTVQMILAANEGRSSPEAFAAYIRRRDRHLWLELESSNLATFFVQELVRFPDAKFILTIRDCYSWVDSQFNHILNDPNRYDPLWQSFYRLRFATSDPVHRPEERVLADHGLYPLAGYLAYWARHNQTVLQSVPAERLLVVRTHELSCSFDRMADFLGIPPQELRRDRGHANPAKRRHCLLDQIDRAFVEERVNTHCRTLMDRFFPDVRLTAQG